MKRPPIEWEKVFVNHMLDKYPESIKNTWTQGQQDKQPS